ncbi:hypothetical protein NDS46_31545 (plasmid) [Paenibacillus thiaminolyticus]|uniref:hypothetical protein n=1 Tax=Paenibacillus thiaminolyticus TaxID=49283 RepID=UPI00232C716B|nr:hypothetical protein [Paenibacillus thiaminolyticus]WCF11493.1 hypothetical protein NDS46_31545 [Paenibacillus thiaminolyticus]
MRVTRPQVNIRHYLIMALGGTRYLHPLIDELYNSNKWQYFEAFHKSNFYGDPRLARHVYRNEEKMKQVAGIVEWCYNENNFSLIYKLIKKGYKFSYQYFTRHQNKCIDLDHFALSYQKRKDNSLSDLDLFYATIVLVYLCTKENKLYSIQNNYGELFVHGLQSSILDTIGWELRFSKEIKEQYKNEVDSLFLAFGIPRNIKPTTLGQFLEFFVEREVDKELNKNPFQSIHDARGQVFQTGISKYIGSLSNWVKINGLNEMDLTESIPLTKEEIEAILLDFVIGKQNEGNQLSDDDRDLYIVSTLYLYGVIKELKEVKRLYLDDSQEKHFIELKNKEEELANKELLLKTIEAEYKEQIENQRKEIRRLESEVRRLNRAEKQLTAQLEKREDHSKEVAALRSYVYNLNNTIEVQTKLTQDELIERIQRKKVAVIGGDPNWVDKMERVLPEVRFADIDSLGRDMSYVEKMDVVFVHTGTNKHKYYRALMTYMNTKKARLCYFNGRTNVELSLAELEMSMRNNQS